MKNNLGQSETVASQESVERFDYQGWDLLAAIDALIAHDSGAWNSGFSGPGMRTAVVRHLGRLDADELRMTCCQLMSKYLSDESIATGYGLEDAQHVADWFHELQIFA
jgi:hypothetical protein